MTSLKKLKVFSYLILSYFLFSCAKVPHKGLFTDQQYNFQDINKAPIIIFHQNDLSSNYVSLKYLAIARQKLTNAKIYILTTNNLTKEQIHFLKQISTQINGFILEQPFEVDFNIDEIKNKSILNSGMINIKTDAYYLQPNSMINEVFQYNDVPFSFSNFILAFENPVVGIDKFNIIYEDPFLSFLKVRKMERKNKNLKYLIMGSPSVIKYINEKRHDKIEFISIKKPTPGYFTVGENLIQLCEFVFMATNDCYNDQENFQDVDIEILSHRRSLLNENSETEDPTFLGEKILSTN